MWPTPQMDGRVRVLEKMLKERRNRELKMFLKALDDFTKRKWWKRVWVVQELAM
jgi:hypothetical protein